MEPYLQSVLCPSLSKVLHSAMLHSNFFTSFFKLLSPPLFPACRSLCLSEDIKKLFLKFTNFAFPFNQWSCSQVAIYAALRVHVAQSTSAA